MTEQYARPARYIGRFAPSPTGRPHAGSLVAALASYLDARAHGGHWLLRIEDIDPPREMPGAADAIVATLAALGFRHHGPVSYQSRRQGLYQAAFERLVKAGLVYPCGCTRREIADSITAAGAAPTRFTDPVYPGTCRNGLAPGREARAWRLRVGDARIAWQDRSGRRFDESLAQTVGDFVLRRADGLWAYQLAVVVDDADQGVTDVVRGDDLIGSTARQLLLHRLLGNPAPRHLHLPLVLDAFGEKLSKQTGASAIDPTRPVATLNQAMTHLGLAPVQASHCHSDDTGFWPAAIDAWRRHRAGR